MWRLIYAPFSWILWHILMLPMNLAGYILVPLAAYLKAFEEYDDVDGAGNPRKEYRFTWSIMAPYQNIEDGIADNTYSGHEDIRMRIISWTFRNYLNATRTWPFFSVAIDKNKVGYVTNLKDISKSKDRIPHWWFCWCGYYTNFFWQFYAFGKLWRLWIGYKIYPSDVNGVPKDSYRYPRAGFAKGQFKRIRQRG